MQLFDIGFTVVTILGYPLSLVELIATVFGFLSVYLASRANIHTWSTGVVNELFLFILFYQVHLYADMLLQVYFFGVTIMGWYNWKKQGEINFVSVLSMKKRFSLGLLVIAGTIILGVVLSEIHTLLPAYFPVKAAFPFVDSAILSGSIAATVLLAGRKIETWYIWILVDLISTILFFKKGLYFLGLEYTLFLGMASYGLWNWNKLRTHG